MPPSYTRISAMPRLPSAALLLWSLAACTRPAPSAPPPSAAASRPAEAAARWHCFAWLHGEDFGDRCADTEAGCEAARAAAVKAHREVRACRPVPETVCLGEGSARCYGTLEACQQARARLGSDEETTCQAR